VSRSLERTRAKPQRRGMPFYGARVMYNTVHHLQPRQSDLSKGFCLVKYDPSEGFGLSVASKENFHGAGRSAATVEAGNI